MLHIIYIYVCFLYIYTSMNKLTINTWDQHAISPDDHIHGRLSPQLSVSLSLRWRPPLSLSLLQVKSLRSVAQRS